MAGKFTRLQLPYKLSDSSMEMFTGVVHTGENTCGKPTADNMFPLGVVDNDERLDHFPYHDDGSQVGRNIAVKVEGIAELKLAEAVTVGDRIILKAGGLGMGISSLTAGTQANVLGFAEKSGAIGDVIPVRMVLHTFTV